MLSERPLRFLFLFLTFFSFSQASFAQGDSPYVDELIARARQLELSEHRVWHVIMHYRPRLVTRLSLNDDPSFFLAQDGKTNPQSELEATLRSFFEAASQDEEHPQCRFIARYRWLKREMKFDPQRLVEQRCERYEEWLAALNPAGISLIYPASYLNNPASMFGHTLLRIDAEGQDERTRMLAYAANYGAVTNETSGFVFAVRGLLGGYKGTFSISPYYKRIKKYSDIENRDIWEYQLDFSAEEARRLTELLWEIGSSYFDYFFFDENCSYYLLYLLEYVRPELRLHEQYPFWAIPIDTVKTVVKVPGLIREVHYRPSAATILRHQIDQSSVEEQRKAISLTLGENSLEEINSDSQLESDDSKLRVLELASNFLSYRLTAKKGDRDFQKKLAHRLLVARSSLPITAPFAPVPTPEISPDQGHDTARLGLGVGAEDDLLFGQYEYRPAFHDFLDPVGGYVPGAQIDFMNVSLRQYEGRGVELERFTPIAIRSVTPRDRFIKPISWSISTGVARRRVDSSRGTYAFEINGGPGIAYRPFRKTLVYGLSNLALEYSSGYDSGGFSGGAGGLSGLAVDLHPSHRLLGEFGVRRFAAGQDYTSARAEIAWNVVLNKSFSLRFSWSRQTEFDRYFNTVYGSLYAYL